MFSAQSAEYLVVRGHLYIDPEIRRRFPSESQPSSRHFLCWPESRLRQHACIHYIVNMVSYIPPRSLSIDQPLVAQLRLSAVIQRHRVTPADSPPIITCGADRRVDFNLERFRVSMPSVVRRTFSAVSAAQDVQTVRDLPSADRDLIPDRTGDRPSEAPLAFRTERAEPKASLRLRLAALLNILSGVTPETVAREGAPPPEILARDGFAATLTAKLMVGRAASRAAPSATPRALSALLPELGQAVLPRAGAAFAEARSHLARVSLIATPQMPALSTGVRAAMPRIAEMPSVRGRAPLTSVFMVPSRHAEEEDHIAEAYASEVSASWGLAGRVRDGLMPVGRSAIPRGSLLGIRGPFPPRGAPPERPLDRPPCPQAALIAAAGAAIEADLPRAVASYEADEEAHRRAVAALALSWGIAGRARRGLTAVARSG
eukprot:gnl/TRDRNA2_/TRDRNA2_81103_c0_seq1.p1 gnl/TRDRNA2_/TRDRNA2_81103_c0~~gnl/TRDRNA2_/TRDRNA2_81103_c0_seq1.p1  ORF type:complete len:431 (-),score=12.96 gnl/TRDRNA2_/TRDRNA2_81103_c0_seq1:7-1299(-)